jgi:hypothetical protein
MACIIQELIIPGNRHSPLSTAYTVERGLCLFVRVYEPELYILHFRTNQLFHVFFNCCYAGNTKIINQYFCYVR